MYIKPPRATCDPGIKLRGRPSSLEDCGDVWQTASSPTSTFSVTCDLYLPSITPTVAQAPSNDTLAIFAILVV